MLIGSLENFQLYLWENSQFYLTIFYFLVAAVPISVWVKYFFLRRYGRAKNNSARLKELLVLLGIIAISFLVSYFFYYSYKTYVFYDSRRAIPFWVLFLIITAAILPVIVWIKFVHDKRLDKDDTKIEKRRSLTLLAVIFLLGTLTVPLLSLFYDYVVENPKYTELNYYQTLGGMIIGPHAETLNALGQEHPDYKIEFALYEKAVNIYETVTIVIDAWLEEIVKLSLLIFFIHAMRLVKTIGDAIAFSVLAGLGFAFIENIIYFMDVYTTQGKDGSTFFSVVVFRAIVLSIGHMAFSGIFGYFYGLSKFGLPLYEERRWEGAGFPLTRLVNKIFRVRMSRAYSALLFAEGMVLAMLAHATFNSFLGFGARDYAVYLVIAAGVYIYYLTQRKAGHMVLATLGRKKMSLMAPKDEDVVLELAGMWINEGKYKEVEEMCNRLEQKDPDNAVVKLLYAKAHDRRRVKRAKLALASLFFQEDIFEDDVSIFQKWKQIRAEREAVSKGVDVKTAEDLTTAHSGIAKAVQKKPAAKSTSKNKP